MRISDWSSDVCSSDLRLPTTGRVFVSVKDSDKPRIIGAVKQLTDWGWQVIATGGTADYLAGQGVEVERVNRSEEHTSELQSLMRISYAVLCLQKKTRFLPLKLRSPYILLVDKMKYNALMF